MSKVLATPRQRVLYEAREIWRNGFVTYDSETTGLLWEDQVIQWAVCASDGKILGSGFVKPIREISESAFKKHGISNEQLADAPSFAEVWPTIRELLSNKTVVIYNANFDVGKLWSSAHVYGIEIPYDLFKEVCAMNLFAQFYGEVHSYYGTYAWQPLNEVALPHLDLQVPGSPHDAEHDALATAMVMKRLAELADQELPRGWHPPVNVPCAGCGQSFRECAEAEEVWYCQSCGLEKGVFHRCPGCNYVVKTEAVGSPSEDLCDYCHQKLYQEKMLLTGMWHRCPDGPSHIVETPDLDEPCVACLRQREWKRKREQAERERQTKLEQERRERRRASSRAECGP